MQALDSGLKITLAGVGATLVLDLWGVLLKAGFGVQPSSYRLIGRWIGYFPQGRFVHESVAQAPAIAGESVIGWSAHYIIGILYAALLVAVTGGEWLKAPTPLPAILVGLATVAAPLLVMQPAMGLGFAASKARRPGLARTRSLAAHAVFGLGLYFSGLLAALILQAR